MKKFDKIKDKMQEKAKEISDSIEHEIKANKGKKTDKKSYQTFSKETTNPEQVIGTMWSYFIAFWIGTFISVFAFFMLLNDEKSWFLAVLIIIAWPFWAIFCMLMMVPTVKIFGVTIFSRKNLSLKRSVSIGKRILYTFSREFYNSNPKMFFFLLTYLILVIVALYIFAS